LSVEYIYTSGLSIVELGSSLAPAGRSGVCSIIYKPLVPIIVYNKMLLSKDELEKLGVLHPEIAEVSPHPYLEDEVFTP
jgi:hypothetical protein